MNKEAILPHLREAKEELDRTISELETNTEYEFGHFIVGMGHIYHHLNTAWHGRDASRERHRDCACSALQSAPRSPAPAFSLKHCLLLGCRSL